LNSFLCMSEGGHWSTSCIVKRLAPSHLWVGPCGVSLRACHHCHPLRRDLPGGCSNRLILYNIRVKPWCSRPRTIWAGWRRSNAKYPWSLSLCLIENVVKKNPNGHSTSSIPHSGVDGRGGYAGKEVTCACTGIFHKESAVCTLNCLLNFLSVFDGATVFIQRHDWNWSIKQCETMFANPTKLDRLACPALMRSTLHIEGGGGYLFEKLLNCRNSRSNPSLPPGHVLAFLSVADKYTCLHRWPFPWTSWWRSRAWGGTQSQNRCEILKINTSLMGARDKFQRGLWSSRARRASSPWKSSDYRKNKFKRIVLFVFFTPMNVQKASIDRHWSHRRPLFISNFHFCPFFEGATVFRQRRVDLLGAGFKDSRGRVNVWGVHHSLNRCEVLLKYLPNGSEPEVRSSQ